jgi:thioredoxin 1
MFCRITKNSEVNMAELVISDQNFETEVLNSKIPVLVDFWAPWCGPCKMIAPVIEELSAEYDRRIKVGKLNTDENMTVTGQFQVTSIPTIMIFKDKKVVHRIVGFKSKVELKKLMDSVLTA